MLEPLLSAARSPLAFLTALCVVVFVHEMGHFLAARLFGIKVEAFSIGFGKPLARRRDRKGTEWRLGWIPLGGYVSLHGMERASPGLEGPPVDDAVSFRGRSVGRRAAVIAAGPLANVVLAVFLVACTLVAGGRPVLTTEVGHVIEGGAAAEAGIRDGDVIRSVAGTPVATFRDVQARILATSGHAVDVVVTREGHEISFEARPKVVDGVTLLGVRAAAPAYLRVSVAEAVPAAFAEIADAAGGMLSGLRKAFTTREGVASLSGPIGLASASGDASKHGTAAFVWFMSMLSLNLAVVNLLPVPVLDGGYLAFYALEAVRGRPLSTRTVGIGMRVGMAILATLMLVAAVNDLSMLGVLDLFSFSGG